MALNQQQKRQLSNLMHRQREINGIILALKDRAAGKSLYVGETEFMIRVAVARRDDLLRKIRKLTAAR